MAQKIQESIPEQIYANIALHSDSENIVNDNILKDEFPATASELKAQKKTNSLQRFFWRKKTDTAEGPVDIENKLDISSSAEKKFLNAKRMHLHLGRHIPRKRSDSLPKREHGEMDLLKKSSSASKTTNNDNRNGSGLRAYFSTYWNYIFSRNKSSNDSTDEIYEQAKPNQTDETENKLRSVIANSNQNIDSTDNKSAIFTSE